MASVVVLGVLLTGTPAAAAQDWHDAYRAGLRALSRGQHADAAAALQRAIALHPEPGRNVLTYGTNVEPRYFPYLRLAEARLGLGQLDAAREALERSASWGTREPADERQALRGRLEAAVAAARPAAPLTSTPPQPPTPAAPTPAPAAAPTPSPTGQPTPAPGGLAQSVPAPLPATPLATPVPAGTPIHSSRTPPPAPGPSTPSTGVLEVISEPPGAAVYVDDEAAGDTDPQTGRLVKRALAAGKHRVRVARAGYEDAAREVDVSSGTVDLLRHASPRRRARSGQPGPAPGVRRPGGRPHRGSWRGWRCASRRPCGDARRRHRPIRQDTHESRRSRHPAHLHESGRVGSTSRRREWFGDYTPARDARARRDGLGVPRRAARRARGPQASAREPPGRPALPRPLPARGRDRAHAATTPASSAFSSAARSSACRTLRWSSCPERHCNRLPEARALRWSRASQPASSPRSRRASTSRNGKGVVHRDLKPSNIMLLPDGTAQASWTSALRAPSASTTLTATVGLHGHAPLRGAGDDRGAGSRAAQRPLRARRRAVTSS